MLEISLQLHSTYTHAISVTKSSPNTTLIILNHIPNQLYPSLYMIQCPSFSQHKLFHCTLWDSRASAKFPISSRSSPHYSHFFILSETCSVMTIHCQFFLLPKHFCFFWSSARTPEVIYFSMAQSIDITVTSHHSWRFSRLTHYHLLPEHFSHHFLVISKSLRRCLQ